MEGSEPSSAGPGRAARARDADGESLRSVLVEAGPAVRRYLFGMCGRWDEAEDAAQEALLKAWAGRESFDGRADPRTWLFAIARNHWRDRLRRGSVRPQERPMPMERLQSAASTGPPARAARAELAEALDRALDRLPPAQREALALRESEGLSFLQIAGVLGVPAATVKSRVRYALAKLAEELKPFQAEWES